MKKIFLLLGAFVGFFVVFYFLLIYSSRPMGLPHLMVLMILGAGGLFALCEALHIMIDNVRKAIAEEQLQKRLQQRPYYRGQQDSYPHPMPPWGQSR